MAIKSHICILASQYFGWGIYFGGRADFMRWNWKRE